MTARLFMNSVGFGQTSLEVEAKSFSFYANKSRLQNFTVLDVGASVGNYTRSLLLHTKAQIVCFEPSPQAFKKLNKNFASKTKDQNSRVKIYNLGIIENRKKRRNINKIINKDIYSNRKGSDLGSLIKTDSDKVKEKGKFIQVNQITQFVDKKVVGIKLDVEGYEFSIIKDLNRIFHDPDFIVLQFEFGARTAETHVNFKNIYDFLTINNFEVKRISPHGLIDIVNYSYLLEVNWPTNYLAVKKAYID